MFLKLSKFVSECATYPLDRSSDLFTAATVRKLGSPYKHYITLGNSGSERERSGREDRAGKYETRFSLSRQAFS